jgi:cyclic pyranopterin phosphate synthase
MRSSGWDTALAAGVPVDGHGRRFKKLRVSITETCNFRCLYCGGDACRRGIGTTPLSAPEIIAICKGLCNVGIEEIRLTGGEPTLRSDLKVIVTGLSGLPLRKLGLTTNAMLLKPLLPFLDTTACRHINISLDSLKPGRFRTITGSRGFEDVLDAVIRASKMGFHVKLNTVLLRGVNDDEVFDYLDFSARYNIEVRFLELMRIGPMVAESPELFVSAHEVIDRIRQSCHLLPELREKDSTSFNFRTDSGSRIGFIASESRPFCGACTRLRLTSRGTLRACLMDDCEINILRLEPAEYPKVLRKALGLKPACGMVRTRRSMCSLGG